MKKERDQTLVQSCGKTTTWSPPHSIQMELEPQVHAPIENIVPQDNILGSFTRFYEGGDPFQNYRSVGPPSSQASIEVVPLFITPRTSSFLGQDLQDCKKVTNLFQQMAQYNHNMHNVSLQMIKLKLHQQ